ncbi:MAG: hypothetical protein VW551_00525 [Euryarchaeota archaeon]
MQTNDDLNTAPLQQFIQQVKSAENSRQKEIRLEIGTAKNLAFTLGIVMSRLHGQLEELVKQANKEKQEEVIEVQMDGGSSWGDE